MSPEHSVSDAFLRRLWEALDTASGVCQIVGDGRQVTDLEDCAEAINAARGDLSDLLDARGGRINA